MDLGFGPTVAERRTTRSSGPRLWTDRSEAETAGSNHFFKEISTVYVSAERCARRQKSYLKRGLGNAFLGYNGSDWSVDDYKNYFEENPSFYRRVAGDKIKYSVDLGDTFKNLDNLKDEKVQSCIKKFCSNLLTQETYNPRVLEKFGLA